MFVTACAGNGAFVHLPDVDRQKTLADLKADILELIEKAVKRAHDAPPEELACLTIDLFQVDPS